jgi:hypothetical protein
MQMLHHVKSWAMVVRAWNQMKTSFAPVETLM